MAFPHDLQIDGDMHELKLARWFYYRLRSEGDNVLGTSVRPSVRSFVSLSVCLSNYQSKGFVCVSVISGRVRIIARRRSIGF